MKLFESTFRLGYEYFERYFDTQAGESKSRKIDLPCEWYVPNSKGHYTSILDDTLKLEKRQGRAKDGREHFGFLDPMYRNIRDNYWNRDAYNLDPRIWYLDIETRVGTVAPGFPVPEKALEPISLIQVYDNKLKSMIVLGVREWEQEKKYLKKFDFTVKYIKCKDEIHLLQTYLQLFKKADPLIIYAWNGDGFDFAYMHNRIQGIGLDEHDLSNYGDVTYAENEYQGKMEFRFNAPGHFYIDLMAVYKKFTFSPRPSYSLDTIAEIELGENKVDHSQYGSFDDFYLKGHDEFVYYGAKDTYLVKRIDEKLNFTVLMLMIAEKMGVQVGDSLGTVKPWSQYIMNKSMLSNQVMPPRKDHSAPYVVGGYVRDPITGKHKWVVSSDVNAMYPLLGMVGFNMSPETFIPKPQLPDKLRSYVLQYFNDQEESNRFDLSEEIWSEVTNELKLNNMALAINGAVFSKDSLGMIPEMVQEIYDSRKKAKKTMFKYEQQKVLIKEIQRERKSA